MIEITEQEFAMMKQLHYNISYTQSEAQFLLDMTRRFVNPKQRLCTTCNASLSEMKQKIYSWFNANEKEINLQLFPVEPELSQLDKVQKEVKNYTDEGTETK